MKKAAIAIALSLSILLSGCASDMSECKLEDERYPGYVYVYTDPDSGVEYLIWRYTYAGGITPRLNADGTVKVEE